MYKLWRQYNRCPVKAIRLHLREDRQNLFDNVMQMRIAIMEGKQKVYYRKRDTSKELNYPPPSKIELLL